jgi:hypothetical protein
MRNISDFAKNRKKVLKILHRIDGPTTVGKIAQEAKLHLEEVENALIELTDSGSPYWSVELLKSDDPRRGGRPEKTLLYVLNSTSSLQIAYGDD